MGSHFGCPRFNIFAGGLGGFKPCARRGGLRAIATLIVDNGFKKHVAGLAKNTPFLQLSEQRVTKAVRDCLRSFYGPTQVEVSCGASIAQEVSCNASLIQTVWQ